MSVVALNRFTGLSWHEREALLESLFTEEEALQAEIEAKITPLKKRLAEISRDKLQIFKAGAS